MCLQILGENAGGVLIYLEDPADIPRVSAWLMGKKYVGPVLCTEARGVALPEGALGLSCLGMEGPRAPDVAFSMAWDGATNPWGHLGFNYAAGKVNKAGGLAGLGTASCNIYANFVFEFFLLKMQKECKITPGK